MLEIKNLTKVYDDGTVALRDLTFEVDEGEFLVIIGLSGVLAIGLALAWALGAGPGWALALVAMLVPVLALSRATGRQGTALGAPGRAVIPRLLARPAVLIPGGALALALGWAAPGRPL